MSKRIPEILNELENESGRSLSTVAQILSDQFLTSAEEFGACDDESLQALGIPLGVIRRIRRSLDYVDEGPRPKQREVTFNPRALSSFLDSNPFLSAPHETKVLVLGLLHRISSNLSLYPDDPKYRSINCISNVLKRAFQGVDKSMQHDALSCLGFELSDSKFVIPTDVASSDVKKHAKSVSEALSSCLRTISGSSITSIGMTRPSDDRDRDVWIRNQTQIEQELSRKKQLVEKGGLLTKVDLNPRKKKKLLRSTSNSKQIFTDDDFVVTVNDLGIRSANETFRSRTATELEWLDTLPLKMVTVIRLISGDEEEAIECDFHPATPLEETLKILESIIEGENLEPLEFFTTPPFVLLDREEKKSLKEMRVSGVIRVRRGGNGGKVLWL